MKITGLEIKLEKKERCTVVSDKINNTGLKKKIKRTGNKKLKREDLLQS